MVLPSYLLPLKNLVPEEVLENIALDSTWADIVDRLSEFAVMTKPEYTLFLLAVADVTKYYHLLLTKEIQLSKKTPRVFRTYLHQVIECVRLMRAALEDKSPESLNDFDEIAADVQRTHDDYATNVYYDSIL